MCDFPDIVTMHNDLLNATPEFDVLGSTNKDVVNQTLSNLINAGAQPMSWGDRNPPYLENLLQKPCLIYDGENLKAYDKDSEKPAIDSIVCIQSYNKELNVDQLEVLINYSKHLYKIPQDDIDADTLYYRETAMAKTLPRKQTC